LIVDSGAYIGRYLEDERLLHARGSHGNSTFEDYLGEMEKGGVDRGVAVGYLDMDYEYLAEAQASSEGRLVCLALVDPRRDQALARFRQAIDEFGLRGLKINGWWHQISNADRVTWGPYVDLCAERGLPVVVHTLGDNCMTTPLQTEELAKGWPTVPFVMAHGGTEWLAKDGLVVAERTENIIYETSHAPSYWITEAVRRLGANRVVMGSGWPEMDLSVSVEAIRMTIKDPEDQAWVLGGTAQRVFGLR
jgi:uncharacterized protein